MCKFCGNLIDWIAVKDGKYIPVDPDPVFVIEGGGSDRFVTDEGELLLGRLALLDEARPELEVAFVPHRRLCPAFRS